jgi:hypothetical protein
MIVDTVFRKIENGSNISITIESAEQLRSIVQKEFQVCLSEEEVASAAQMLFGGRKK